MDDFLTKLEVCDRYKISIPTLDYWRRHNKIPQLVKLAGAKRWRKIDLMRFEYQSRNLDISKLIEIIDSVYILRGLDAIDDAIVDAVKEQLKTEMTARFSGTDLEAEAVNLIDEMRP